MARKSKEQILEEERALQEEINRRADERVQAMVPGLVSQITAQVMSQMQAGGATGGGVASNPEMMGVIRNMALELAKIGDPTNQRQAVTPEIAQSREEGRNELQKLLVDAIAAHARDPEDVPVYTLTNKCFLGGIKIEPQQENAFTHRMEDVEINWVQVPNMSMVPVNDRAKGIHAAYMKSISNGFGRLASPPPGAWVITGNKIRRRGQFSDEPPQVGGPIPLRREAPQARQRKEIPVLGTIAPPVVETV